MKYDLIYVFILISPVIIHIIFIVLKAKKYFKSKWWKINIKLSIFSSLLYTINIVIIVTIDVYTLNMQAKALHESMGLMFESPTMIQYLNTAFSILLVFLSEFVFPIIMITVLLTFFLVDLVFFLCKLRKK